MVIPPGTYVQGTVEKLKRQRGSNPDLLFQMRSAELIFSTGYTVGINGAITLVHLNALLAPQRTSPVREPGQSAALPNAANQAIPVMTAAAITPPTLPPLPSLGNGPRNAIIAVGAVGGAVLVGMLIYGLHGHNDLYLDAGTPMEITLSQPLVLDAKEVTAAVQRYSGQMASVPPQIMQPPKLPQLCYMPGDPGTPDTVVPGTPPTPPVGDTPGLPGTPDTVMPGRPATAGYWYECRK